MEKDLDLDSDLGLEVDSDLNSRKGFRCWKDSHWNCFRKVRRENSFSFQHRFHHFLHCLKPLCLEADSPDWDCLWQMRCVVALLIPVSPQCLWLEELPERSRPWAASVGCLHSWPALVGCLHSPVIKSSSELFSRMFSWSSWFLALQFVSVCRKTEVRSSKTHLYSFRFFLITRKQASFSPKPVVGPFLTPGHASDQIDGQQRNHAEIQ